MLVKRDLTNAPSDVSRHTSHVHSALRDAVGWLIREQIDYTLANLFYGNWKIGPETEYLTPTFVPNEEDAVDPAVGNGDNGSTPYNKGMIDKFGDDRAGAWQRGKMPAQFLLRCNPSSLFTKLKRALPDALSGMEHSEGRRRMKTLVFLC